MSMEDLLKNGKSTTFFVTMAALLIGAAYMFFGPNAEEAAATVAVADFMKSIAITYIVKEVGVKGLAAGGDALKGMKK